MAYVKHKPQYRDVRTSNVRGIGRPRDIRKRLPDMRGKVNRYIEKNKDGTGMTDCKY